jgi:hypothetical protein
MNPTPTADPDTSQQSQKKKSLDDPDTPQRLKQKKGNGAEAFSSALIRTVTMFGCTTGKTVLTTPTIPYCCFLLGLQSRRITMHTALV